jgi:hypothetical protein
MLFLDKMPAPRADPGTMWTPDGGTLRMVARTILDESPGVVDWVWVRTAEGKYWRLLP